MDLGAKIFQNELNKIAKIENDSPIDSENSLPE